MVGYAAVGVVGGEELNKLSAVIFICHLVAYPTAERKTVREHGLVLILSSRVISISGDSGVDTDNRNNSTPSWAR